MPERSGPQGSSRQRPDRQRPSPPSTSWGSSRGPLLDRYDVLLLDLDGVVYVGPDAVPGATETLAKAREQGARLAFVTNNAARPPSAVAEHLVELGVPAQASDVVTSAQAAATLLATDLPAGARVLVTGGLGLREALDEAGLVPVSAMDDDPVAVAQGFAPETSWTMLAETCVALRAGLAWVVTNMDATIPTPRGIAPGNGALVDLVRATTGCVPRVAGKPHRPLMDEALRRTRAAHALVVGDRLDTDIAGAIAAELPSLLVLTGVSGVHDLLGAPRSMRPTYLAADISAVHLAHRAPVHEDGAWTCGSLRATWDGPRMRLDGTERSAHRSADDLVHDALDAVRVVCAALWQRMDDRDDSRDRNDRDDPPNRDEPPDRNDRDDVNALVRTAQDALAPWTHAVGWDR